MPRRKPGALIDLERAILAATLSGGEYHGYELAQRVDRPRPLIGHGTIYKALGRLEGMGLLSSRWEDAEVAELARRPRRRLYRINAAGAAAAASQIERDERRIVVRPAAATP
jgi:DNA-binding PadR family transcriptional regulator